MITQTKSLEDVEYTTRWLQMNSKWECYDMSQKNDRLAFRTDKRRADRYEIRVAHYKAPVFFDDEGKKHIDWTNGVHQYTAITPVTLNV